MIELCRHIKPEGTACKGPAVRGSQFCRHHQLIKATLDKVKPTRKNFGIYTPLPFHFPEDRAAIQTNLFLVLHAFNDRKIDAKAANFMTYNLQVCLSNLSKGGPLAPVDTESAIRRVILTPEGDEIAPPREKLEKDESPVHYKDCPCQSCAEQFRGAEPEKHHADCKCGLCEKTSDQRSAFSDQNEAQPSTNTECHPERSATIGERAVEGPAVCEPATASDGNHQSTPAELNAERKSLNAAVRTASAQRLSSADTLSPIQKEPDYHQYTFEKDIKQHAARARAALEAGLDLGALHLEEMWDGAKRGCLDGQSHPDQPKEFKPFITWGEEHDLKLAEMKRLREQDEARLREQAASAS